MNILTLCQRDKYTNEIMRFKLILPYHIQELVGDNKLNTQLLSSIKEHLDTLNPTFLEDTGLTLDTKLIFENTSGNINHLITDVPEGELVIINKPTRYLTYEVYIEICKDNAHQYLLITDNVLPTFSEHTCYLEYNESNKIYTNKFNKQA